MCQLTRYPAACGGVVHFQGPDSRRELFGIFYAEDGASYARGGDRGADGVVEETQVRCVGLRRYFGEGPLCLRVLQLRQPLGFFGCARIGGRVVGGGVFTAEQAAFQDAVGDYGDFPLDTKREQVFFDGAVEQAEGRLVGDG